MFPGPLVPGPPTPRRFVVAFWILAIALYVGLRAIALDADAPRTLAHGGVPPEMLVEPPAKAHEARNWAVFGAWKTHPVDNYQFWRPQSPAWVYPLAGTFKVFGTSYATLRLTATAFGIVGLVALALWGHRRWGPSGAVMAAIFLATDNVGIFWGRSGLLEPIVVAWVALAFYCLDRAFDHVAWGVGAIAALAIALTTKLAALPAVPVFAVYGIVVLVRAEGVQRKNLARLLVGGFAAAVLALLIAWVLTENYQRTLAWNFQHMVAGRDGGADLELGGLDREDLGADLAHLPRRFKVIFLVFSALALLGIAESVLRIRELFQRRVGLREALPVAWLLSFAVAVVGATFFAFRFVLLLGPPLLVLSVDFIHRTWAWLQARRVTSPRQALLVRRLPWIATGLYAVVHLGAWGYALSKSTYEVRDAAAIIQRHVDGREDAVCIGLWSSPLVLETTCKHFYVKSTFNATREALGALRPTFLLLKPKLDDTRSVLRREWPELMEKSKAHETVILREDEIVIFEASEDLLDGKTKLRSKRVKPARVGSP